MTAENGMYKDIVTGELKQFTDEQKKKIEEASVAFRRMIKDRGIKFVVNGKNF